MPVGRVEQWDDARGFGFIREAGQRERIFFHRNDLMKTLSGRPRIGGDAEFSLARDPKGRTCAVNVQCETVRNVSKARKLPVLVTLFFLSAVWALALLGHTEILWPVAYSLLSIVAYGLYASDKRSAEAGRWRTPESTLHFVSLIGGWPGALIAQTRLRHKTKKGSFQFMFWYTVAMNLMGFALVNSEEFRGHLQRVASDILR